MRSAGEPRALEISKSWYFAQIESGTPPTPFIGGPHPPKGAGSGTASHKNLCTQPGGRCKYPSSNTHFRACCPHFLQVRELCMREEADNEDFILMCMDDFKVPMVAYGHGYNGISYLRSGGGGREDGLLKAFSDGSMEKLIKKWLDEEVCFAEVVHVPCVSVMQGLRYIRVLHRKWVESHLHTAVYGDGAYSIAHMIGRNEPVGRVHEKMLAEQSN
eukprot:713087-Rhodomonas_salina.1